MVIKKDIKFDCAHILSNYEGKCANLHGHTYHGVVTLKGSVDPVTSMLLDYNKIKEVVDMFDHAIVFSAAEERNSAELELHNWAELRDMKHVDLPRGKSTAENISIYIASMFVNYSNVTAVEVSLSETDGSLAIAEVQK